MKQTPFKICSIELDEIGLLTKFINNPSSPFNALIADNGGSIYLYNFEKQICEQIKSKSENSLIKVNISEKKKLIKKDSKSSNIGCQSNT